MHPILEETFCLDEQQKRAVAKQRELPVVFSHSVQVPTATLQWVITEPSDLQLFHKVKSTEGNLFGVMWHGEQNHQGVGSLCRLTSIITSSTQPERKLVQAEVVGRMALEELIRFNPYATALVSPLLDGLMREGEKMSEAEEKLWLGFEQFMSVAGKLYMGCLCDWETYTKEEEDDEDSTLEEGNTKKSLLKWCPDSRYAQQVPEKLRRENFSFAAARALGLPNEEMQKLLACTSTLERMQIVEDSLSECTRNISARCSIREAFE